jgi:hypothetical protein
MTPALGLALMLSGQAGLVAALLFGLGWVALAAHILACASLIAVLPRIMDGPWAGPLRLLAITLPVLGPFALLAGMVALAASPRLRRDGTDAEAWRASLFPATDAVDMNDRLKHLAENAQARRGADRVVAFADVLERGDLSQQERVVALMAREYRPDFAPLLRAALNAPTRPLRAQAAAALTMIETRLSAEAQSMRQAGDAVALARKLDEMANSGLLEAGRARALRSEAAALWRSRLAAAPQDAEAAAALGRDLLQLDEIPAAREALEDAYALGLMSPALIGWLAEARFRTDDLAGVETLIRTHRAELMPLLATNSPLALALRLWLEEVPA